MSRWLFGSGLLLAGVLVMALKPAADPPSACQAGDKGCLDRTTPSPKRLGAGDWMEWEDKPRSSRLPVVMLDADGRGDEIGRAKVGVRVRIIANHDGTVENLSKARPDVDSRAVISIRGSSSAIYPQKSYTFGFVDEAGSDRKLRVLDMPKAEDFALIACWADKPCMRNSLAYAIGRRTGAYHPRLRFVEVYLDGGYQGIYQLTEPPRADKQRVPVSRPALAPDEGDISGGYILRREMGGKGSPTSSPLLDFLSPVKGPDGFTQTVLTYHYPKASRLSEEQRKYVTEHFAAFETMMLSPQWNDRQVGYEKWLDVTSWIDFALVNELSNNVDAYWKSMYITKQSEAEGGKLLMQPFWDFNIAFGNASYRDGEKIDRWVWRLNRFGGENQGKFVPRRTEPGWNMPFVPFWYEKLWAADPTFTDRMKCRYRELRRTGAAFDLVAIDAQIENWRKELKDAMPRHFSRWPELMTKVWPNAFVSKHADNPALFFDDETSHLKRWVLERIAFLDANLPGVCRDPR